jgi:hypothetical protein
MRYQLLIVTFRGTLPAPAELVIARLVPLEHLYERPECRITRLECSGDLFLRRTRVTTHGEVGALVDFALYVFSGHESIDV